MAWQIFLNEFACGHFEIRRSVETKSVELPNSGPAVKMNLQVLSGRCKKCPPRDCTGIVVCYSCGHPMAAGVSTWRCQQQQPGEDKDKNHAHQNPKYLAVPLPEPCDRDSCDKKIRLRAIQPLSVSTVRGLEAKDYSRWAPVIPPRTT
ncbi:hypothetical protein PG997_011027 [Apiospora hydei]|uniref:Uncharacterized protein n=1 Tax=Apiospora hydei TaxID=1337664 RepID=A0ABR1VHY1_9PEZI